MVHHIARGLPADWLNAWLAAIGVTVLVSDARLGWTDDPVPRARFSVPDGHDLATLIANALPTTTRIEEMAFAGLNQSVSPDDYHDAAQRARESSDDTLAVVVTDLAGSASGEALVKGNFNVGMEGKESLDRRLLRCRRDLPDGEALTRLAADTLDGRGRRTNANGLGFDYRRLAGPVPEEALRTADPLIECLCFFGTTLFHTRGNGHRLHQRGWPDRATRRHGFLWPTWRPALDRWAIDGLLDLAYAAFKNGAGRPTRLADLGHWGLNGLYGSVPFEKAGRSVTKGYAAERLA